jgi:hypothetical protein
VTATTEAGTAGETSTRRWDDRGFYRKALAVVAPLPMLAMGTIYLLTDMPGSGTFKEMLAAATRQESTLNAMSWVQLLFFAFLVPAVIAVAAVTRARSPRLTAVGVVLTVPGLALGCSNGPGDTGLALLTVQKHLDVPAMIELDGEMQKVPTAGVSSLLFIIGIVIGLLLLGIGLARSGAVPVWFGVALAFGGFTHPFMPTHVLAGIGLYVAAIGFAGASLGLLRMRNDQFAPPVSQAASSDA